MDRAKIRSIWCPKEPKYASWRIETSLPSSPFNIIEDGEIYCVGAVIDLNLLTNPLSDEITKDFVEVFDINSINDETLDGQRLMGALAIITTTSHTDKTPAMVLQEIDELRKKMYEGKFIFETPPTHSVTFKGNLKD